MPSKSSVGNGKGRGVNGDTEQTTWMVGFSRYASLQDAGLNPAMLVSFRHKPESEYGLALFTLGGRAVNSHVSSAIHEAFFTGGLKRSRIIGSRYFDTPGVGSSYQMQDYGRVSVAASWLNVKAGTTARLVSHDVSGYGTLPGSIGPVVNPFVGITWNEFSDLVYDPVQRRLDERPFRNWSLIEAFLCYSKPRNELLTCHFNYDDQKKRHRAVLCVRVKRRSGKANATA